MKAILRTNDYTQNYEIVDVINNPISDSNSLAHIKKIDGREYMTGGILVEMREETMMVLDKLSNKEQYNWLKSIYKPACKYIKSDNVNFS